MILFWALSFLIGSGAALHPHWILLLPLGALIFLSKRKLQNLIFCALGALFTLPHTPTLGDGPHTGKGIFKVQSIAPSLSPFGRSYRLRGVLKSFDSNGKIHYATACSLFQKTVPPSLGSLLYVEGTLENRILKLGKRSPISIEDSFSLALFRFACKEKVRRYFHRLSDRKVGHFFATLTTGDLDDQLLAMEFRKWGLSHVLAISGFHFALLAWSLSALLRALFPYRGALCLLLFFLTLIFTYLGPSPSIMRAYIMIALYLVGLLLNRNSSPLNLLGVALLLELLIDPLCIQGVGFWLSFAATFGILAFYTPFERGLRHLLPKRPLSLLKEMPRLDQHGYLIASILRKGLALNGAVHLVTLPILLCSFHTFPLMSFAFNLFFPPLLGLSLICLPLICLPLEPLNILYTRFLLDLLAFAPELLNIQLTLSHFPPEWAIALCTPLGILGLTLSPETGQNGGLSRLRWRS